MKFLAKKHQKIATYLALTIIPMSGFATDIYLPSLPSMAKELQVSQNQIQFTITLFLVSYGACQLLMGSVLDRYGRYQISLFSFLIFSISSFGIAFSHDIHFIYLMRFIQGASTACFAIAMRAFFVDVYEGKKRQHYLSLFTIFWSIGPIIAPWVGGYVETGLGWRANFILLGSISLVFMILQWLFSGETLKEKQKSNFKSVLNTYKSILSHPSFTMGLILLAIVFAIVMLYGMSGPFIIEHNFGKSPIYTGYASLLMGLAWLSGGLISRYFIDVSITKKMTRSLLYQFALILLMLVLSLYFNHIAILLLFAFLIHLMSGVIYNTYFAYCLSIFPKNAGIAGGITGGGNYVLTSFLSYSAVFIFPAKDLWNLALGYFSLNVVALIIGSLILIKFPMKQESNT